MEEENQNSSITILLVISVAVVVIVGAGWFLLDGGSEPPAATADVARQQPTPVVSEMDVPASETLSAAAPVVESTPQPEEAPAPVAETDADLRKARLAAEADILTEPEKQSALHYYGRVLEVDPQNEVANAELDAVLGRLAVTATEMLAAEDWAGAYQLATRVSAVRPDHALVNEVTQTLDRYSGALVTQAMELAESGDDEAARTTLAQAESLPGRNRQYFQAVRESIGDLVVAREAAEAEAEENARVAAAQATADWMESVRGAIAEGRLIAPAGDCAFSLLQQREEADEISAQIRQELVSAVMANAATEVETGALDRAEQLLTAATDIGADTDEVSGIRANLEQAYIERESARVLPITELVRIKTVPAKYPRRAEERGISGWVEVLFTVTPTGETANVTVASAEPESVFDDPAVEAVEQWEFEPREYRGQVIAQRATAKLVFRLQ